MTDNGWDKQQVKQFVKDVVDGWGKKGWVKLSAERKRLELHAKALSVVMGQSTTFVVNVPVEAIRKLVRDMETEASAH